MILKAFEQCETQCGISRKKMNAWASISGNPASLLPCLDKQRDPSYESLYMKWPQSTSSLCLPAHGGVPLCPKFSRTCPNRVTSQDMMADSGKVLATPISRIFL